MFDIQQWQIRFFAARLNSQKASKKSAPREIDNLDLFLFRDHKIFSNHPLSVNR